MKFPLISFGLCIVAGCNLMPEKFWLAFVSANIAWFAFRPYPSVLRVAAVAVGAAVLFAHSANHKIYGKPTIYKNRILDSPRQLVALAHPNIIVADNGSRFELRGITFTPEVVRLYPDEIPRLLEIYPDPVLIQPDSASPSGVVFERRIGYFCGNTFFPRWLPRQLPRYVKDDLGKFFTRDGYATSDLPTKSEPR